MNVRRKYSAVFFAVSLSYGRRRTIANLLRHLSKDVFEPILVLMHGPDDLYGGPIRDVPVHVLDTRRAFRALLPMTPFL